MKQLIFFLSAVCLTSARFEVPSPYTWRCEGEGEDAKCVRHVNDGLVGGHSMHTCKLTCGPHGMLWPKPTMAMMGKDVTQFFPTNLYANFNCTGEVCDMLDEAFDIFRENLDRYHPEFNHTDMFNQQYNDTFRFNNNFRNNIMFRNNPNYRDSPRYEHEFNFRNNQHYRNNPWTRQTHSSRSIRDHNVTVMINVTKPDSYLTMDTNESYNLRVNEFNNRTEINIHADTFFGARHALETLSQMIQYCEKNDALQIVSEAVIRDSPAYRYRGILLDTSRNFFPVEDIKRTLDAMSHNKLNTFHWHITDSHSFPMRVRSLPNMVLYGAYSSRKVYEPEDIRDIVEYGRIRGIRVLPEFDAPAHVGNGFQWGKMHGLGELAVCVNQEPWQSYCVEPPCGQLNIANEKMYEVLHSIYEDMAEMFSPVDLFHFGGDEVNLNCWNSTNEIVDWMTKKGNNLSADSYYKEWSNFQTKAQKLFTQANKKEVPGIIWTSHLTEAGRADKYLDPSKYIIQIWTTGTDPLIKELLEKDFKVIFSNYDAWYLDCGFGAWVGEGNNWCSPYKGWQKVYDNKPSEMAGKQFHKQVMGGEAALWSEQADSSTVDSRLWPRGAALAERLWSDPEHNWKPAEFRLINQRQRMAQRGIKADRIQPEWCHQNEGLCYL